jgi:hypothetical protein
MVRIGKEEGAAGGCIRLVGQNRDSMHFTTSQEQHCERPNFWNFTGLGEEYLFQIVRFASNQHTGRSATSKEQTGQPSD